jgi:hypothetical protein
MRNCRQIMVPIKKHLLEERQNTLKVILLNLKARLQFLTLLYLRVVLKQTVVR